MTDLPQSNDLNASRSWYSKLYTAFLKGVRHGAPNALRTGTRITLRALRTAIRPLHVRNWTRRRVMTVAALAALGMTVPASWWFTCGYEGCPSIAELQAWQPTEGGTVLDANGQFLGAIVAVKRVNVPLARVPVQVQRAFIAVEDRRFRTHHGVDWHGVARAMVVNVRALGVREGASTITMQLARNVFLAHRATERSFGRKFLEWRYAGLLEHALSKDEILERYLNAIYLGNGVYGVEGASRDLFGKSVANVTLAEAAVLAGLPKAPTSYSPRRDIVRARARRDVVLSVLDREEVAPKAAIVAAHAFNIRIVRDEWTPSRTIDSWALELVRTSIDSMRANGLIPVGITNANLNVHTTFDRKAQRAAERAVARGAAQVDAERGYWAGSGQPQAQGALVALDPATGAIRALVGGRRIERRGFNRAMLARRQPGSAFKPFVYLTALQQGYTTVSMVEDEPVSVQTGDDIWTPANYGDNYGGRMTLRQALVRSANAATVRVSRDVGIARVADVAEMLGIHTPLPRVPALALGAGEVTPLELTAAYAPLGNGGYRVTPHMLLRVEDAFGHVLWKGSAPTVTRVIDSTDAFLVTSMLRSVVDEGTGRGVRSAGIKGPVAGKTGTTNDGADVWFVGYTPTIVAAVWFGLDSPQPLGSAATGGHIAAPAWSEFVRDGWHSPSRDLAWQPPPSLVALQVDNASGLLASDWCGESRREWFKPGTEPHEQCTAFFNDEGNGWLSGLRSVFAALPDVDTRRDAGTPSRPPNRAPGAREPMSRAQRSRDQTSRGPAGRKGDSEASIDRAIDAVTRQIGRAHLPQALARKLVEGLRAATREGKSALKEQQRAAERETPAIPDVPPPPRNR